MKAVFVIFVLVTTGQSQTGRFPFFTEEQQRQEKVRELLQKAEREQRFQRQKESFQPKAQWQPSPPKQPKFDPELWRNLAAPATSKQGAKKEVELNPLAVVAPFEPHSGGFMVKNEMWMGAIHKVNAERTHVWVTARQNDHSGEWIAVTDIDIYTRSLCGLATEQEMRDHKANLPTAKPIPGPAPYFPTEEELRRQAQEKVRIKQLGLAAEEHLRQRSEEQLRTTLEKTAEAQAEQAAIQREMLEIMRREAEIREMRLRGIRPSPQPPSR